jgi:hypothetical protein
VRLADGSRVPANSELDLSRAEYTDFTRNEAIKHKTYDSLSIIHEVIEGVTDTQMLITFAVSLHCWENPFVLAPLMYVSIAPPILSTQKSPE